MKNILFDMDGVLVDYQPANTAFLNKLGWRIQDTLFIDHVQANVDGAVAAGLVGRRCDSEVGVCEAMTAFLT